MIGHIILRFERFIKQNTCIHNYRWTYRKDNGDSFLMCEKCKKKKHI
jgi:hypothetical protein